MVGPAVLQGCCKRVLLEMDWNNGRFKVLVKWYVALENGQLVLRFYKATVQITSGPIRRPVGPAILSYLPNGLSLPRWSITTHTCKIIGLTCRLVVNSLVSADKKVEDSQSQPIALPSLTFEGTWDASQSQLQHTLRFDMQIEEIHNELKMDVALYYIKKSMMNIPQMYNRRAIVIDYMFWFDYAANNEEEDEFSDAADWKREMKDSPFDMRALGTLPLGSKYWLEVNHVYVLINNSNRYWLAAKVVIRNQHIIMYDHDNVMTQDSS
ncbi:hypothetical protein FNV43_RR04315 [Rhamnella rubrinervis]|uniref:Ubiquitin-like protease family profile domain-containing protein n=1 Tax=Rhamnella rubrinervis TaxID=2594499 RepID=A0A8K0MPY1_9ROSA|nr:hypothetical protein FNV43_RR04315 [Rhamnella rubrinervis]